MGYVSEYVEEKHVNKYSLLEMLKRSFANDDWSPNSTYRYMWSFDRKNENFLIHLKNIAADGFSGRPEPTAKELFLFFYNKEEYLVTLEMDESSSSNFKDSPFLIRWNLCDLKKQGVKINCSDDFISNLKESLVAFQYDGVRYSIPNTVVEFGF